MLGRRNNKDYDYRLSIILIAHNEGDLAMKTVRSLVRATKFLDQNGVKYQWLANIDNGNKKTISLLGGAIRDIGGKVYYTKFGDPGRARNYAIKKANGEYVAIIDADDIVSDNWLIEALRVAINSKEPVLVHPWAEVRFDTKKIISVSFRTQYRNRWHETLALIEGNRWCSVVLGRRDYFLNNPYSVSKNGFGYEDYFFNCSTVLNNIHHVALKKTIVFCLQKDGSVSDLTHKNKYVLPYSELFNLKRLQNEIKEYQLPKIDIDKRKDVGARNEEYKDYVLTEIRKLVKKEESLKYLERCLKPNLFFFNNEIGDLMVGVIFCRMIAGVNMRFMPRTIRFVDDLSNYDNKKMSMLTWLVVTDNDEALVADGRNKILDFGFGFGKAPESIKDVVLERIIVQTGVRLIKCNSLAKTWATNHSAFVLQNGIRLIGE